MTLRLTLPALVGALALLLLTHTPALAWDLPLCLPSGRVVQASDFPSDAAYEAFKAQTGAYELQEGQVCPTPPTATPDPTPVPPTPSATPSRSSTPLATSSSTATVSGSRPASPSPVPTTSPSGTSTSTSTTAPARQNGPTASSGSGLSQAGGDSPGADTSPPLVICEQLVPSRESPTGQRTVTIHRDELPAYRARLVHLGECRTPTPTPSSTPTTRPVSTSTASAPSATPTTMAIPQEQSVPSSTRILPPDTSIVPPDTITTPSEPEHPGAIISDAPLCARWTPDGVMEGLEVCQTTEVATVAPMTVRPALPTLLPRTGAPVQLSRWQWVVAGALMLGAGYVLGRRRRR